MWICAYICKGAAVKELIKTIKALSDETRIRILNILLVRECCVCEVMQALELSQSRASRNLGILKDAGFLKVKREGTWVLYSVNWETPNHCAASLAELMKDFLPNNKVLAPDRERLKKAMRTGAGCR